MANRIEQLAAIADSPEAFRKALLIDTSAGPRPFADCMDDWQRQDFAALDPAWRRLAGRSSAPSVQRAWLERPRGHNKTGDQAAMATWALVAAPKQRPIYGVAAAVDRDQAALIRDRIDQYTRINPWLLHLLEVQAHTIKNRHTGSELEILSADCASSYGLTPDFILCDEVTHWQNRDLWDSLFSAAPKRSNCLFVVITNAGFADTWQAEVREIVREDPRWHFHRLESPVASWITAEHLAEQRKYLPAIAFNRLWLNQWSSGSGDAIQPDEIEASLTVAGELDRAEEGFAYTAGLDIGLRRDASALVVVGRHVGCVRQAPEQIAEPKPRPRIMSALADAGLIDEPYDQGERQNFGTSSYISGTDRLRLAAVRVWRPSGGSKVSFEPIEDAVFEMQERFGLSSVGIDPWQAQHLAERLGRRGVRVHVVDFIAANLRSMCSAVLDAFGRRQIDLYPNDDLLSDLRSLRVEERNYGVRLTSPRTSSGHGDVATGLSIALHESKQASPYGINDENRILVCSP